MRRGEGKGGRSEGKGGRSEGWGGGRGKVTYELEEWIYIIGEGFVLFLREEREEGRSQ